VNTDSLSLHSRTASEAFPTFIDDTHVKFHPEFSHTISEESTTSSHHSSFLLSVESCTTFIIINLYFYKD